MFARFRRLERLLQQATTRAAVTCTSQLSRRLHQEQVEVLVIIRIALFQTRVRLSKTHAHRLAADGANMAAQSARAEMSRISDDVHALGPENAWVSFGERVRELYGVFRSLGQLPLVVIIFFPRCALSYFTIL